jgi:hypothetical protein
MGGRRPSAGLPPTFSVFFRLGGWLSVCYGCRSMMLRRIVLAGAALAAAGMTQAAALFPAGSQWKFFVGTTEASFPDMTAWRQPDFADSGWATGATPIGYGPSRLGIATDLGRSDAGGFLTVYLRKEFEVPHPADYSRLNLPIRVDDGYVVWLNGVEIGRFNVPDGELAHNSTSVTFTGDPENTVVTVSEAWNLLREGRNVLAVHLLNANWTSSDLFFDASLTGEVDTSVPVLVELRPPAGATVRHLETIEVRFSKPVDGVDASDLLINGVPASAVTRGEPGQFAFQFPEPAPGLVQLAWAPTHGITDMSSLANPFPGGSWTYTLDPTAQPPGLLISEFMASNLGTLNDEDGDRSDWIEIYNSGEIAEDLGGWFLTDDAQALTQWRFPSVTLLPNRHLVVFASGKDRRDPTAPLHTNFRLAKEGEFLALLDPRTNIVSAFAPAFPVQFDDVSYGRDRVNPELTGYFDVPTPGAPNAIRGDGFAPEVRFSRPGGTFLNAFNLELAVASHTAQIRFTTDGTLPTAASALYSSPIPITSTTQVRARTFEPGLLPGPPASAVYLQIASSLAGFTSDLPMVVIDNFGAGSIPSSTASERQLVGIAIFEPDATGRTSLTNVAAVSARAGINIRGSSTRSFPKPSYRLEFWDEFGEGQDQTVLGMPEEEDWILYAPNMFDVPLIHNPFAFRLSNDLGRYAPRTRMVEVFVNTVGGMVTGPVPTGHYRGVYVLSENIKRGADRVSIERLAPEHTQPPEVTGGYLLKIDRRDADEREFSAAEMSIIYRYPSGLEMVTPQRSAQASYIRNYFNAFFAALTGPTPSDPATGYEAYIDVESWIDHHLLNVIPMNVDALRLSAHFHKGRERRIEMGPVWDFDRSMGTSKGGDTRAFNPRNWRGQGWDQGTDFFNEADVFSNPWYRRLFRQIDFWQRYIDRYQDLRETVFSDDYIQGLVDSLADEVREAQPREVARWRGSGSSDTSPRIGTESHNGYWHTFPGTYQGEIDFMKRWLTDRLHFMDTNFLSRPIPSHSTGPFTPGERLSLSGPPGATLYYTLDGTDPRSPGGAVASAARVYSGPIPITSNARLFARARNLNHQNLTGPNRPPLSTPWSGATIATLVVETPPLVITEVMYHPPVPPPGSSGFHKEQFEYIELLNRGAGSLNLDGFQFVRGIRYTFTNVVMAAGQRLILAKDLDAFRSRYGLTIPVVGPYEGQLDNSGERITLVGRFDEPILDFRYRPDWHPSTDGHGFSLVIRDPTAMAESWNDAAAWRPSSASLGSPGSPDPAPPSLPVVWINEALAHTDPPHMDAIELFNPGSSVAEIGGWYLTDDFGKPTQFRIPDGTRILPGGFVVFDELDFNTGAPGSFALSSLGEEVYLFSADPAGGLTGFVHGFRFGASENGVSFGRHVTHAGTEQFVAQIRTTLGAINSGPRVGPVVINELMYHPAPVAGSDNNTRDEFIELHNVSSEPVLLYHPAFPANTWRLRSAVQFDFPPNQVLPPNGYLLIVGFNPDLHLNDLHAFRQRYSIDPSVTILGPFDGRLDNSGERVRLLKPDSPQTSPGPEFGLVPYVLVEEVDYANAYPWPDEAKGTGFSIQRIVSQVFGNEPHNWHAAVPTPGGTNVQSLRDTNQDGLPDWWKLTYGLSPVSSEGVHGPDGDPDRDDFPNREEFIAGTDPQDPLSFLRFESVLARQDRIQLEFQALADRTYRVLYRDAVGQGIWQPLVDVPAQAVPRTVVVEDSQLEDRRSRFYRLVIPQ